MSGPGTPAGSGSPRPAILLRRLRHSEAKRLELERKLMEYKKSDAYLMKLKYMKLKKYLKEVVERQNRALLRNQALFKDLDQLEAHLKTSSSAVIQKMEMLQVRRQIGISSQPAMPRGLYHPATVFMGHQTSAVLAAGGLGMQQKPLQLTGSFLAPDLPLCSPSPERLGPESRSTDLMNDASVEEAVKHGDLSDSEESSEQLIISASKPKPATQRAQPQGGVPGPKLHQSDWWARKEASRESSDELPVPTSAEGLLLSTPDLAQGMTSAAASGKQDKDAHSTEDSPLQPPTPPMGQEEPSVSEAPDGHSGTLVGPSPVLQLIEEAAVRMSLQHRALYQDVETMGTAELLSFCHRADSLKEVDLEACEAVVLHQLRALLQSRLNGCLPPEETLDAKGAVVDEKQTRPVLLWDMDMLQSQLSHHALFLRKHQVQLPEEVAGMFDCLLLSSETGQDGQALPVLREVLPEECGDRSSIQSNESSYSLPAAPNDSGEIKQAKRVSSAGGEEVTSWCEDESKEGSTVEKIPITGGESDDNSSESKASQEKHSQTSSSLKERSLPFSRPEIRRVETAIKSKAFWGESDDSSSEIEAALRPQTGSPEADDFDDFYD